VEALIRDLKNKLRIGERGGCKHWLIRINKPACENALGLIFLVENFPWDEAELNYLRRVIERKLEELKKK